MIHLRGFLTTRFESEEAARNMTREVAMMECCPSTPSLARSVLCNASVHSAQVSFATEGETSHLWPSNVHGVGRVDSSSMRQGNSALETSKSFGKHCSAGSFGGYWPK